MNEIRIRSDHYWRSKNGKVIEAILDLQSLAEQLSEEQIKTLVAYDAMRAVKNKPQDTCTCKTPNQSEDYPTCGTCGKFLPPPPEKEIEELDLSGFEIGNTTSRLWSKINELIRATNKLRADFERRKG